MEEPIIDYMSGTDCAISFSVDQEKLARELDGLYSDIAKTANIRGFRKGKISAKIAGSLAPPQQREEMLKQIILREFYAAVRKIGLSPAGFPEITSRNLIVTGEAPDTLRFQACFEVYPEVEHIELASITLEKPNIQITDSDIDQMIESIRAIYPDWVAVDRRAREGDRVLFDLRISGIGIPAREMQSIPWIVGVENMSEEFEKEVQERFAALFGHAESRQQTSFELAFPMNHDSKNLAGRKIHFDISIREIAEPKKAELSDDFVRRHFPAEANLNSLRVTLREQLWKDAFATVRQKMKSECLCQLIQKNEIDIPYSRVKAEAERIQARQTEMGRAALTTEESENQIELLARRQITLGMLMAKIVREQNIKVSRDMMDAVLENLATSYENPDEVKQWYLNNPRMLDDLQSSLLEDLVLDWLLTQVNLEERDITVREIMNVSSLDKPQQHSSAKPIRM